MAKIGIIGSRGYPSTYGGFETFVRRLAPYLVRAGHEVTVYGRSGAASVSTASDGVRSVVTKGIDSNALSTLTFGATAARHARSQSFDSVLALNVANGFFLSSLSAVGIRTFVNPDGLEWERAKWNRIGKEVFLRGARLTAKHAHRIVVDSRAIGRVWQREFNRESDFIPYGADVEYGVPDNLLRESTKLVPGNYILAVARITPENNIGLFCDAIEQLPLSIPAVVVGSANKANELTQRLKQMRIDRPNFHWLGHVADQDLLKQLWAHAAVYFHGHTVGGTNPALLQALGYGAPTIAVDTPYNLEVLADDRCLVPQVSACVASHLRRVYDDTRLRDELRHFGRDRINGEYLWPDVLEKYCKVLTRSSA